MKKILLQFSLMSVTTTTTTIPTNPSGKLWEYRNSLFRSKSSPNDLYLSLCGESISIFYMIYQVTSKLSGRLEYIFIKIYIFPKIFH